MSFISTYSDTYELIGSKKYVRTTRFAQISSGTSGSVTLPSEAQVVLDDFGGTTDAIISAMEGGKPNFQTVLDAEGNVIATTFDLLGNWVLSGTPVSYPIAIIYRIQQQHKQFDSDAVNILGSTEVADTRLTIFNKQDKITGAASTVTTANLTPNRLVIANTSGKLDNSSFLKVDETLGQKVLSYGTDQTVDFGDGRLGPDDTGSEIQYGSGYAYAADTQYHAVEIYAYNIINGQKYYWQYQTLYVELEADGSDAYQILWQWDTNYIADGYFVVKYDDTHSGEYYADVATNSFLENFTDWSTQTATPIGGFLYDSTQVQYNASYPYAADTQYHAIEVYAYRVINGITVYEGGAQYYEGLPDGSNNYRIQWNWFEIPNVDGYVIIKYDDTHSGEYCVIVSNATTFLEDFTDWSTKTPTPILNSSVTETEYKHNSYTGFHATQNSVTKTLVDYDGPLFYNIDNQTVPVVSSNRVNATNFRISGNTLKSLGSSIVESETTSSTLATLTLRGGLPRTGTTDKSGQIILETRTPSNTGALETANGSGDVLIRSGNAASNTRSSAAANYGGFGGKVRITSGNGGNASGSTTLNVGSPADYVELIGGKGGDANTSASTTGNGGTGAGVQIAAGSGGTVTSTVPNRYGNAGSAGTFLVFSGNGGSLTQVNGNAGKAGPFNFISGLGGNSTYSGSGSANKGGDAGLMQFRTYRAGDAANSTISNTGGNARGIEFTVERGGDGATAGGTAGNITFTIQRPGTNSVTQGTPGNITFSPSPAALSGLAEGNVIFAPTHGKVGVGTTSPQTLFDINGTSVRIAQSRTPSSATDTGVAGEICWDSDYVYVCVATNTWKRTSLVTW